MSTSVPSPNKSSIELKEQGNNLFFMARYDEAIQCYSTAIIKDPSNAVLFTNRALCYFKLEKYQQVIENCTKALDIDINNAKANYLMGTALSMSDSENIPYTRAINHLKFAYQLALQQGLKTAPDYGNILMKVKKEKWKRQEEKRLNKTNGLMEYITRLMNEDLEKQEKEIKENSEINSSQQLESNNSLSESAKPPSQEARNDLLIQAAKQKHMERLNTLKSIFAMADPSFKERDVPEYFCGKLTLTLLKDPVMTKSGITYDREEILQHFNKVGYFDPFTREPLTEKGLFPNRALKECLDKFVEENGWCVDF